MIPSDRIPTARGLRSAVALLLAAALLPAAACDSDATAPEDALAGGVLATFRVSGEEFRVWTDDGETIDQLLALEAGESGAHIPNGPLLAGPGRADHNEPWSWHLDPGAVEMAEVTVEVCDGRPSFVEEELDYWLSDVGRFCPWGAELVELEDHR